MTLKYFQLSFEKLESLISKFNFLIFVCQLESILKKFRSILFYQKVKSQFLNFNSLLSEQKIKTQIFSLNFLNPAKNALEISLNSHVFCEKSEQFIISDIFYRVQNKI